MAWETTGTQPQKFFGNVLHKKSFRTAYPAELHALFEEIVWGNPPSELIDSLLYYKSVGSTFGSDETTCLIVLWARK